MQPGATVQGQALHVSAIARSVEQDSTSLLHAPLSASHGVTPAFMFRELHPVPLAMEQTLQAGASELSVWKDPTRQGLVHNLTQPVSRVQQGPT